jgi:hypothetical protein
MNDDIRILRYTRGGKDCAHDIHFIKDNTFLRYGTDEEMSKEMYTAVMDVQNFAADISAMDGYHVKRITFSADANDIYLRKCKIEGIAATRYGENMKVFLPAIEWREVSGTNEITGEDFTNTKATDERLQPVVDSILKLIVSLQKFVSAGNQQIEFAFVQ